MGQLPVDRQRRRPADGARPLPGRRPRRRRSCCRAACASSSASRRAAASSATSSATRSSRHERSRPHRLAPPPARRSAAHGDDHRRPGRDARRLDGLAAVARDPGRSRRARAHAVGVDPLGRARLGPPDPARGREDDAANRTRPSRRAVGGAARRSAPVDLPRRRQGQHRRRARRLPVGRDHRRAGALQPDATCSKPPAAASTRASWRRLRAAVRDRRRLGRRRDAHRHRAARCGPAGATDPRQRALHPYVPPADPPLMPQSASQLAWLGIDAESLRALDPYVVLLPDTLRLANTARVNVNTAPREVLVAVVDELDLATAERIVQSRQRAPLKSHRRPDARSRRACQRTASTRLACQLELLRGARPAAPRRRRARAALAGGAQRARRRRPAARARLRARAAAAREPRQSENQCGDFAARSPPKSLIAKGCALVDVPKIGPAFAATAMSTLVLQLPERQRLRAGAGRGIRRRRRASARVRLRHQRRRHRGRSAGPRRRGAAADALGRDRRHPGGRRQLAPHHPAEGAGGAPAHGAGRRARRGAARGRRERPPRGRAARRRRPADLGRRGRQGLARRTSSPRCRRPASSSIASCRWPGPTTRRPATSTRRRSGVGTRRRRRHHLGQHGRRRHRSPRRRPGARARAAAGAGRDALDRGADGRRRGRALARRAGQRHADRAAPAAGRAQPLEPAPVRPRPAHARRARDRRLGAPGDEPGLAAGAHRPGPARRWLQIVGLNLWAWHQQSAVESRRAAIQALVKKTFPRVADGDVQRDPAAVMLRETQTLRTLAGKAGDSDLEPMLQAAAAAWPGERPPVETVRFEARQAHARGERLERRADRAVPLRAAPGRRSRRRQRRPADPDARPQRRRRMSTDNAASLPPGVAGAARSRRGQFWRARAPRERQLIAGGAIALAVLVVWLIAVQPALRTLREAPAELDRLDSQLQQMQLAAFESAALRSASPVPPAQADRSAARRDRAARRQGQDRAAGRPRRAHLLRRAVRGLAQLARRGAQRGARAAGRSAAPEGRFRLQRLDLDHPGGQLMIRKKRNRQLWSPTVASTGWSESTLAEQAWVAGARRGGALGRRRRHRRRARRAGRCSRRRRGWRARSPRRPTAGCSSPMRAEPSGPAAPLPSSPAAPTAATRARCPAGSSGRWRRAGTASSSRRATSAASTARR